jgi:uncharacterized protein Yka (UPF0111/DUF47 family)
MTDTDSGETMTTRARKNIHPLCARCQNRCKQPASLRILDCNLFEPMMSDEEFETLLGEMERIGQRADELRRNVNRFLNELHQPVSGKHQKPDPRNPVSSP